MSVKLYQSRKWMTDMYVNQDKTINEIARAADCSVATIDNYLRKFGLVKDPRTWTR